MQSLRGALIAALLLGCKDDSNGPVQPEIEGIHPAAAQIAGEEREGAVTAGATTRPTIGFFSDGANRVANIRTDFTEITKLSLPAGAYIANVSAVLAATDPEARTVDCIFTIGGNLRGELTRGMVGGLGSNNFTTLPHTIGFTIEARTNLGVACRADLGGRVVSQPSHLSAIRVDDLRVQP